MVSPLHHSVKCTLPLCEECLPIHLEETNSQISHDFSRHVLPIQEAKEKALSWIKADYLDKQNASRTLDDRLADLRQQIVKRVDEELAFLRL